MPNTIPLKAKRDGDEGAGPATAQIGELGDRFGEDHLIRIALKVTQNGRAEDRRHHDGAEEAELEIEDLGDEGAIDHDLAGPIKKSGAPTKRKVSEHPEPEVAVGCDAAQAKFYFKQQKVKKHVCSCSIVLALCSWPVLRVRK